MPFFYLQPTNASVTSASTFTLDTGGAGRPGLPHTGPSTSAAAADALHAAWSSAPAPAPAPGPATAGVRQPRHCFGPFPTDFLTFFKRSTTATINVNVLVQVE